MSQQDIPTTIGVIHQYQESSTYTQDKLDTL